MKNKKSRLVLRLCLLLIMFSAIAYTLYQQFFTENIRVQVGDQAPDFVLEDMGNHTIQLSDFKGRGVILNFWGTWCEPCRQEMPYLESQYNSYINNGVEILAINIAESEIAIESFVERYGLTFPVLKDKDQAVTKAYDVIPIPTSYLIDKNGTIKKVITGIMTESDMKNYMEIIKP